MCAAGEVERRTSLRYNMYAADSLNRIRTVWSQPVWEKVLMAGVVLEHVTKDFGTRKVPVRVVDDLTLDIADRELVVLVGPSGCGKTTTLRLIAGLDELSAGTVRIGGRVVNDVAPKDRDIAMVFQNYALYPHMTVYKNMAFGLKMRRVPEHEIKRTVYETAGRLGLERLLDRRPAALSGGECQRVALGRAIVRQPHVFLLDEPLSNLDARLRTQMRTEIKSLQRDLKTTMIYVTHDQAEAMTMGDRIAVIKGGVLQQCGPPLEVYDRPANRFVAGFIGTPSMNFLPGAFQADGNGLHFVGPAGRLQFPPALLDRIRPLTGRSVVLGVRPEHLGLCPNGDGPLPGNSENHLGELKAPGDASIRLVEPLGDSMNVHVAMQSGPSLVARVSPTIQLSPGQHVKLLIEVGRVHLFAADETGQRIG